tara:strand:+ start:1208 stop:3292 length:2085 start_codon:yes stop_codon:yes gene_type:complete
MNRPPIIQPKINSLKRIVGLSPFGKKALAATTALPIIGAGIGSLAGDKEERMKRIQMASMDIDPDKVLSGAAADPIINNLNPDSIQSELDSLTNSLKQIPKEVKKKNKEVKKDEIKEFDDAKEFKKWIRKNTETDKEGNVSFIQPMTKERIGIGNSPESNVLLYEVFKEQTGRTGEAAEAIATMDISELQQNPYQQSSKAKFLEDVQLMRGQDVPGQPASRFQNIANTTLKGLGTAAGLGVSLAKRNPYLAVPLGAAGYLGGDELGKNIFGSGSEKIESSEENRAKKYAEAQARMLPIDYNDPGKTMSNYQNAKTLAEMDYEEQQAASAQRMAFRKPGGEWELTPTPITPLEVRKLSEQGYEFAPENMDDETFFRQATLAGRDLSGPSAMEIEEAALENALTLSKIEKNYADMQADTGPSPFMHKKAYGIKLPGMYSRNSNEGLEYKVRLLEDEKGNTRLTADLDLAPVMAEIYRAERYTEETQEEIEEVRDLLGPDTVGLAQRANDIIRGINALSGTSRGLNVEIDFEYDEDGNVVTDEFGQPILDESSQKIAAEVLSRWAKRFTAQNITVLLGESNRTISDADRKRADDIVNLLGTTTDMTSAWIALDELLHIFEKPSQNANTALQALYAQADQSGYMDEVLEIEEGLSNEIKRGGSKLSIPQSSRFKFQSVSVNDIPKDAVIRTINVAGGS